MYRSFSGPLFERNENFCPFLGEHLEPLYQPIRFKLASALTNWHPSDPSAKMILQPWTKVLFATSLLFKSHPASGAFLSLSRFWLPRSQSLTITFFLAGESGGGGGGGIREFQQRRFWATHVNRKWVLFAFHMTCCYHICIPKCVFSRRDNLPENLLKSTPQDCNTSTSGWRVSLKNVVVKIT